MIKVVAIGLISALTVGLVSLAWPRLTPQARPVPLQKVHDVVLETQVGQQAAQTLGVTDEKNVVPINPSAVVASVATSIVTTIEKRTQQVVVENAVKQLTNQFDQLPQDQKQQIQTIICKP
ncbi:MAG: hypothetical protein HY376_02315 [Candidatus Blackburnbacteria bacterium]|nr:hypothetical protein [Candidatus Blackburnbacteria bacterium]